MSTRIFICYAHRELEAVRQDVEWLRAEGFSIFIDERIHPGAEWAQELAEAIDGCDLLLFFNSSAAMDSPHCRNEIAYAVDVGKPVVTVFCEPLALRGGLKLTIARFQAVVRWQLSRDEYRQQLKHALTSAYRVDLEPVALRTSSLWRVPLARNLCFAGRSELLAQLRDHSAQFEHSPIVLTGPAGVGKTQLALEYVYRHARSANIVAWIRAENSSTLVADLVELATELKLAGAEEIDTPVLLEALKDWLGARDDWLIVLDNVESPEMVRRYLPPELTGRLLMTSRRQAWGRLATTLSVDAFASDEAQAFLLDRTGQKDAAAAANLAELLGCLPLALEEAAAYMEATGRSLATYVTLFEQHHDALMASTEPVEDYPRTLRTTLEVSLDHLTVENALAAQLLQRLAFLAPDAAELSMLAELSFWPQNLETPAALLLDRCVASLCRYSLVKAQPDAVSTHRLTQLVVRDAMTAATRERITAETLDDLTTLFPRVTAMAGEVGNTCRRLLPHALAALEHARSLPSPSAAAGALLGRTGTFMSARSLAQEASDHLAESYRIFRELPQQEGRFARTCELYGRVLYNNGSLDHSRQTFQEALPIFAAQGPAGFLHLVQIHLDLAWVSWTLGDFADACASAQKSLELLESIIGKTDPHRAISLSMLSRIALEQGCTSDARAMMEEVATAVPQLPELDQERQPLLCAVLLQLAQVLRSLGSPLRAQSWAQESLLLGRPLFSEHHTLMGATHCVLGQALLDLEDLEGARLEFQASVDSVDRHRYPSNQHVFLGVCLLALTQLELGETQAAATLIANRLNDIDRQIAGEAAYARGYAALARGRLAHRSGVFGEAWRSCEAGDQHIADRYGESSPYRLYPLALAAESLYQDRRCSEAASNHELALAIVASNGLEQHPLRAKHMEGQALLAEDGGDVNAAIALRYQALAVYRSCLGPSSRPVARLEAQLGAD